MKGAVLVTRPGEAGKTLCELIEANGGKAIHFPTIDFEIKKSDFSLKIKELTKQDWLIFISPNAAKIFFSFSIPLDPTAIQIAAAGSGTAKILEQAGFNPFYPTQDAGSEGILALSCFKEVRNQRIMIIRGEGGRTLLAKTLSERGAIVNDWVIYKRVIPNIDCYIYQELVKKHQIYAIVCASFEGVINLKKMLKRGVWNDLKTVPLIVVSKRIKLLVENLGFENIWVAEDASHSSIIKLLI